MCCCASVNWSPTPCCTGYRRSGGFLLRLPAHGDSGGVLRGEVHDSGGGVPAVREPGEGCPEAGGRGLLLVAELRDKLADEWVWGSGTPGKIVWCESATPP